MTLSAAVGPDYPKCGLSCAVDGMFPVSRIAAVVTRCTYYPDLSLYSQWRLEKDLRALRGQRSVDQLWPRTVHFMLSIRYGD